MPLTTLTPKKFSSGNNLCKITAVRDIDGKVLINLTAHPDIKKLYDELSIPKKSPASKFYLIQNTIIHRQITNAAKASVSLGHDNLYYLFINKIPNLSLLGNSDIFTSTGATIEAQGLITKEMLHDFSNLVISALDGLYNICNDTYTIEVVATIK